MAKEAGKKIIVTCYREECEFQDPKTETCLNDELSVGQSGFCLNIDDTQREEEIKIPNKKSKKHGGDELVDENEI